MTAVLDVNVLLVCVANSCLIAIRFMHLVFLYLVCPRESFHTGSMTTGLMAHSRMAKAKANSLALLHICTALFQLDLKKKEIREKHKTTDKTALLVI